MFADLEDFSKYIKNTNQIVFNKLQASLTQHVLKHWCAESKQIGFTQRILVEHLLKYVYD